MTASDDVEPPPGTRAGHTVHGSCLCGGVAFAIDGPLTEVLYCHCSLCRKAHGSAFRARATVQAAHFRWLRGEGLVRHFESSPGTFRGFCGTCGSNLVNRFDAAPAVYGVALGVLDDDPGVRPTCHVHVASQAPWYGPVDGLPRHAGAPPRPA